MNTELKIAVIGLGYVGLPLAAAFAAKYPVVGFDIDARRIAELESGQDRTLELSREELEGAENLVFTTDPAEMADATVYVITTPTPINEHKEPDLRALKSASTSVGMVLKPGDTVIYESTVYPGATEELCVPILTHESGLVYNVDFTVGYSPERINPGDKVHGVTTIVKVTSGSTEAGADFIDRLYSSIVEAGTYRAPSIKVAEAAKVIENTQRDVNIALINELALLFNRLGIDTGEVLRAAGTKWNFLNFSPGLVGGHCIGVDPYYLTHKAQAVGFHPEIILAGRRINDSMGSHVAREVTKALGRSGLLVQGAKVLILGLTFKENTPDLRNTRVVDVVTELEDYGLHVDVYDPWADPAEAKSKYGIDPVSELTSKDYVGVILAVAHENFRTLSAEEVRSLLADPRGIVYDLKAVLPEGAADMRL